MKAFTKQEQQRINNAVTQAEQATSGEIVPVILAQADDYQASTCHASALVALAASTVAMWWHALPYWAIALLLAATYLGTSFLLRSLPKLRRRLIATEEITFRVDEQAMTTFVRHGLHHTRDETGILILICLFEKRVQVLADRGINEKVEQKQWDDIVSTITTGLHNDHACDALCNAIEQCGELLTPHFPIKHDDTNELPNIIHH
ncbi:MAG: TPM domain-containing protein [Thermodesulfobacteriota bacterium]|nr:TPM domain-containing protein [Thermodesulfobacteriota bacterium]